MAPLAPPIAPVLLRLSSVCLMVGFSKAQIYRLIKRGQFPSPVRLGGNSVRWQASQVHAWIAEKVRACEAGCP